MEWETVDRAMRRLSRAKASFDADEATWLVEAARVRVWTHAGLGSLTEYLVRLFGYGPRQVAGAERMRVAIALETMPRMHRALAGGEMSWSAVRELSRVANCQTEAAWIDADRASADTHVGESDRRPRTQVLITVCEECGAGTREGAGVAVPVEPAVVERASCDARILGTHVGAPEKTTSAIPEPTRRYIWQRDGGRCVVPGCRAARYLDLHHIIPRADGGNHDRANLVLLCNGHHDRVHDGKLRIEGTAPDKLRFLLANGSPYGTPPPVHADHRADAERALRQLGFDKPTSRRAAPAAADGTLEAVIRDALHRALAATGLASRLVTVSPGAVAT